jgi:hypothetical protein
LGDPDQLLAGYGQSAGAMAGVGRDHGLIFHAATNTDEGLLVVNLRRSKDGSDAAAGDARRLGVIEQRGLKADAMRPEHHEVANHVVFDRPCLSRRRSDNRANLVSKPG